MAINGVIIGLFIYLSFSMIGKGVNNRFFKSRWLIPGFLGCIIYFGLIQFTVYFTNIFRLPNNLLAIGYIGLLVLLIILSLNKSVFGDKKYFIVCLFSIFFACLLVYRSSFYTVGSTSDSAFYMSMVNENAFTTSWSSFSYYNGTPLTRFNPYYDYQSFYHLFAYLEKIYAQFFTEISYVPIYVYSALTCYLALLAESILYLASNVFEKNKKVAILGLILVCVFNSASWHLLYGYFGHTWRVGILSIALFSIYKFFQTDDNKWLYLLGLSTSALIAVMSSALFTNGFIIIALILTLIATQEKANIGLIFVIFPTYNYMIFYLLDYSYSSYKLIVLFMILFAILCFLYLLIFRLKLNIRRLCIKYIIAISFILMTLYGIFGDGELTYTYFFGDYYNELSVPYFGFSNVSLIVTNLTWLFGAIICVCNLLKYSKNCFRWFLIISVVLFVNPFVISFITEYLTKVVYYRYLETFINYYTCFVIAYFIHKFIKNNFNGKTLFPCCILSAVLFYPLWVNFNNNPFYYDLTEPINPTYRIPESELEADLKIAEIAHKNTTRLRAVSQGEFTKAVVRNVRLIYDINYVRSFCKTCNASGMPIDAPSEMHNLFMIRDYADQPIYKQTINWDNACNAQFESDTKLLMINKNQTKLKDGVYVQIWLDMRACNDVIFENDEFVVLEFR